MSFRKIRKRSNLAVFLLLANFFQKRSDNFSLFLVYSFLGMILINCQEMDFIEIFKRSFFKIGNGQVWPISHNYWYYSVATKCCPNLLYHVASLLWNQSCPKIWKVCNHSNGHFQGQKGPMWSISVNILETVHDKSLYEIHIVSHIWPFCLPDKIWPLMILKGQIKVNDILIDCYLTIINETCYCKVY